MYRVLGNRVLYEIVKFETKSAGGIYLSEDTVKSEVDVEKGKVMSYGPVVDNFQVGDIITVTKHAYKTAVKVNNKPYKLVDAEDILAVESKADNK